MKRIYQGVLIVFSSIILSLAIPNELLHEGSFALALIALFPFYIAIKQAESFVSASFMMGAFAMLVHIFSSYWLAFFKDFAVLTLGFSALGTAGLGAASGLLMFLPRYFKMNSIPSPSLPFPVHFSIVYIIYEWIKSVGFLGYPWGVLSVALASSPLFIQIADITGTYGVSFLLAFFSALLAEAVLCGRAKLKKEFFEQLATCALFFALTLGYGIYWKMKDLKVVKELNAIFVQQNINPWNEADDEAMIAVNRDLTLQALQKISKYDKEFKPHVIVWSEGILRYAFPEAELYYQNFPAETPLLPMIKEIGLPFIIGGTFRPDFESARIFNAALYFDSEGNFRGAHGKNHLVPLAEALPFTNIPAVKNFFEDIVRISAGWSPGDQYVLVKIPCDYPFNRVLPPVNVIDLNENATEQLLRENAPPSVTAAVPICYSDAFPDVCTPLVKAGAEVFLNLTDDSWSRTKSAEYQHLAVSIFRTVETRTTLARCTNSGVSSVISAKGEVLLTLPLFEALSAPVKIPIYEKKETVYMIWGNYIPVFFTVYVFFLLFRAVKYNKNRDDFRLYSLS